MRKILIATFGVLFTLLIVSLFGYKYLSQVNQKIVLQSDVRGFSIQKSNKFPEFEKFLNDNHFWDERAIQSSDKKLSDTAKKLVIIYTDKKQPAGIMVTDLNGGPQISSFGYSGIQGVVTITIQIDKNTCKLPACDPELVFSKQLIRATYESANLKNQDKLSEIMSSYNEKYIKIKKGGLLSSLGKFKIVGTVLADCVSWRCQTRVCDSQVPQNCACSSQGIQESSMTCNDVGCLPGYCDASSVSGTCNGIVCGSGGGGGGTGENCGGAYIPPTCPAGQTLVRKTTFKCAQKGCCTGSMDFSAICGTAPNGETKYKCFDYLCIAPTPVPVLSASCPPSGNSATLSWTIGGATSYRLAVDDTANGWVGSPVNAGDSLFIGLSSTTLTSATTSYSTGNVLAI